MGIPTSEVGYIPAMPRREDHEVHKGRVVALDQKIPYYGGSRRQYAYIGVDAVIIQEIVIFER